MVACIGPLAAIDCEPRQARKGATVAVDSGAEVWLVQVAASISYFFYFSQIYWHHYWHHSVQSITMVCLRIARERMSL